MTGHGDRYALSKAIVKAVRSLSDAEMLFTVLDDLLIEVGDAPMLPENKRNVEARFKAVWAEIGEIKIILAEDKHGRVRHE